MTINAVQATRTAGERLFASLILAAGVGVGTTDAAEPPPTTEVRGMDLGGKRLVVFVARDKAAWDSVKKAMSQPQMLPRGFAKGGGLDRLDGVDFQKDMIVAVFWGQISFAGQDETCWIEGVTAGKGEIVVDCRAHLWGGAVKHAYLAWPYHAKTVKRSELPVTFVQSTDFKAMPSLSKKDQKLVTLQPSEWQWTMQRENGP